MSIARAPSQVPPFKEWIVTGAGINLLTETGGQSIRVAQGALLRDMGKKVYLPGAGSTLVKVKVIPETGGSPLATEANSYRTGYISLGDGTLAASEVALLN